MNANDRIRILIATLSLVAGAITTAGCLGGASEEEADELTVTGGSGTFVAGQAAIEEYGSIVLQNQDIACSSANGVAGAIAVIECSTGQAVSVAGVAATARGSVSIGGGDGTSRSANGSLAVGAAAQWDANAQSLDLGGLVLGQYTIDMGTQMPSSASEANALFDAAFGSAARYDLSLDQQRQTSPRRGSPVTLAWYAVGSKELTGPHGQPAMANIAVGIVRFDGRVLAVQTTGFDGWAEYAR